MFATSINSTKTAKVFCEFIESIDFDPLQKSDK